LSLLTPKATGRFLTGTVVQQRFNFAQLLAGANMVPLSSRSAVNDRTGGPFSLVPVTVFDQQRDYIGRLPTKARDARRWNDQDRRKDRSAVSVSTIAG
jgi:hypothetical protein